MDLEIQVSKSLKRSLECGKNNPFRKYLKLTTQGTNAMAFKQRLSKKFKI